MPRYERFVSVEALRHGAVGYGWRADLPRGTRSAPDVRVTRVAEQAVGSGEADIV